LISAATARSFSFVNYGEADQSVNRVSLVSLIANPAAYDGRPVRVIGAFQLAFEGNQLCLHKEDLTHGLSSNCFWIEPDLTKLGVSYAKLAEFNGKYVLVEGTFVQGNHGHMGMFSGAITPIWRVALWR
jgi:hypothetical protein